jgi:hypothetical protein
LDALTSAQVRSRLLEEELRRKNEESENLSGEESALMSRQGRRYGENGHKKTFKCYHCGRPGHKAINCRERQSEESRDKASLATTEKKHDLAFMAHHIEKGALDREGWCVDSGATQHLCSRREWFSKYESITPTKIYLADDGVITARGKGTISLRFYVDGKTIDGQLLDVLYVPELDRNLLSVNQIVSRDFRVIFERSGCVIERRDGERVAKANRMGGLYKLVAKVISSKREKTAASSSSRSPSSKSWKRKNTIAEEKEYVIHEIASTTKSEVKSSKGKTIAVTSDLEWEEKSDEEKSKGDDDVIATEEDSRTITSGGASDRDKDEEISSRSPAATPTLSPHPSLSTSISGKPKRHVKPPEKYGDYVTEEKPKSKKKKGKEKEKKVKAVGDIF